MGLERSLKILTRGDGAKAMAETVKVAFATSDRKRVDQHFGAAEAFAIYAVGPERAALVAAATFGRLDMDGNEDKLATKIAALEGCVAVYCIAVGASAISQLRAQGIQPVKVAPGTAVAGVIEGLQRELRAGPSPWLARALEQGKPKRVERFDEMEAEGWLE
jgi:nitrogen fixation protein NifX